MLVLKQDSQRHKLAADIIRRTNYQDSYGIRFNTGREVEIYHVARVMFSTLPDWTLGLLRIRDILVKLIGLRGGSLNFSNSLNRENFAVGRKFGMWQIAEMNENEVVFAENDSHLNFTFSLLLEKPGDGYHISASTRVKFNNSVGRWYFAPVKPFHKIIVKSMLKKMAYELMR